jgi:HEAT repeat protein
MPRAANLVDTTDEMSDYCEMNGRAALIERAELLGTSVNGHPENTAEAVPELVAMLRANEDPEVLAAVVQALGHAWTEEANLAALALVDHPHDEVRLAVARAIPGGLETRDAIEQVAATLITLSADRVDEVRDWATFGLGTQLSIDGADVRAALWARIDDPDGDTRDEALVGLARRRDHRIFETLLRRLGDPSVGRLAFEAAEFLADPRLLPDLRAWADHLPDDDDIKVALAACDPQQQEDRLAEHRELMQAIQARLDADGRGGSVSVYCDCFTNDVLLAVSIREGQYSVPHLLDRATGDPAAAADLVMDDYGLKADAH